MTKRRNDIHSVHVKHLVWRNGHLEVNIPFKPYVPIMGMGKKSA